MKLTNLWLLAASTVLTMLITATDSLVVPDGASVPLDDQALSSIRGADIDYNAFAPMSCENMGVMALNQIDQFHNYTPASNCTSVNLGQYCGRCTVTANSMVGINGPVVPYPTGQKNTSDPACGNVQYGICGVINPTTNPPTYGCTQLQVAMKGPNQPYTCSSLFSIRGQASSEGAF